MRFVFCGLLSLVSINVAQAHNKSEPVYVFGHAPICNIIIDVRLKPSLNNSARKNSHMMPYDALDFSIEQTDSDNDRPDTIIKYGIFNADTDADAELRPTPENLSIIRSTDYSIYPKLNSGNIFPSKLSDLENKHFFVECIPGTITGSPNKGEVKYWSTANVVNVDGKPIMINNATGAINTPTATSMSVSVSKNAWATRETETEHLVNNKSYHIGISIKDEYGYSLWENGTVKKILSNTLEDVGLYSVTGNKLSTPVKYFTYNESTERGVYTVSTQDDIAKHESVIILAKFKTKMGRTIEVKKTLPVHVVGLDIRKSEVFLSPDRQTSRRPPVVTFIARDGDGEPMAGLKPSITVKNQATWPLLEEQDGGIYKLVAPMTASKVKNGMVYITVKAPYSSSGETHFNLPLQNGFLFTPEFGGGAIPRQMDKDEAISITNETPQLHMPRLDDCAEIKRSGFLFTPSNYYWVSDESPSGLPYSMSIATCEKRIEISKNIKLPTLILKEE